MLYGRDHVTCYSLYAHVSAKQHNHNNYNKSSVAPLTLFILLSNAVCKNLSLQVIQFRQVIKVATCGQKNCRDVFSSNNFNMFGRIIIYALDRKLLATVISIVVLSRK